MEGVKSKVNSLFRPRKKAKN